MMDYFVRLLKQTGVLVTPESDLVWPRLKNQETEAITPLELEAQQLDEPKADEQQQSSVGVTDKDKELKVLPAEVLEVSRAEYPEPVAEELFSRPRKAEGLKPPLEGPELTKEIKPEEPFISMTPVVKSLELQRTAGPEKMREPDGSPLQTPGATTQKSRRGESSMTPANGYNGMPREKLWRAVAEEVRRGVASQPALTTPEQRTQVAEAIIGQVKDRLQRAPDDKQGPVIHRSLQPETPHGPGAEVYELNLSIGTIKVTVNQPEKEIPPRQSPPARRDESTPEILSRRLSRHYIVR